VSRKTNKKHGAGQRWVEGKDFQLADEVRYIQNKAAEHDGRVVSFGQLVLFSTDTGDAWLLDLTDQLAAPLARDGHPEPIHLEETDTNFAIGWKGHYHIQGLPSSMLTMIRARSGPSLAILPRRLPALVSSKISNMFG
jgi:hypothetical protein